MIRMNSRKASTQKGLSLDLNVWRYFDTIKLQSLRNSFRGTASLHTSVFWSLLHKKQSHVVFLDRCLKSLIDFESGTEKKHSCTWFFAGWNELQMCWSAFSNKEVHDLFFSPCSRKSHRTWSETKIKKKVYRCSFWWLE